MNDSTNLRDLPTPTTRFCPECAAKVRAVPSRFDQPVQCPNCKALVFFWDLRTETLQATKSLDWIDHHIRIGWLAPACYMFAGLAGFALLLFLLGLVIFPIVLCVLLACVGLTAFGYTLTHLGELKLIRDHRLKLDGSILDVRAKQREIAVKYEVSQKHLQDIIKEDQQKLEMIYKRRLYEVDERETKLKSLEEMLVADAQQKIGLSSETLAILASKYLDDMQKWLVTKLTTQNLNQSRERFLKLVAFFEKSGYSVSKHEIELYLGKLKEEFEALVRKQLLKEEQARIKERMREEQKVEQEYEREQNRLEAERKLAERLLEQARSQAVAENSERIAELERLLSEAESKQRSLSMAQQTRAGNVYITSNIGSFGEGVFKIGMTRRLDPMDRIRELGDASVPFSFDVHMMIACRNAPTLERELHQRFSKRRLNKINFRKEFFRVELNEIIQAVQDLHGVVEYVAEPEALEYRESISMSEEEFEYIEDTIGAEAEPIDD